MSWIALARWKHSIAMAMAFLSTATCGKGGGGGAEVSNQQRGCSSGSICIKGDHKKHIHEVSSSIGTNKE